MCPTAAEVPWEYVAVETSRTVYLVVPRLACRSTPTPWFLAPHPTPSPPWPRRISTRAPLPCCPPRTSPLGIAAAYPLWDCFTPLRLALPPAMPPPAIAGIAFGAVRSMVVIRAAVRQAMRMDIWIFGYSGICAFPFSWEGSDCAFPFGWDEKKACAFRWLEFCAFPFCWDMAAIAHLGGVLFIRCCPAGYLISAYST